jgi:hypothetical protein
LRKVKPGRVQGHKLGITQSLGVFAANGGFMNDGAASGVSLQPRRTLGFVCAGLLGGLFYVRLQGPFGWEWYQGALFLAPIGLRLFFFSARWSVFAGLVIGPIVAVIVDTAIMLYQDPGCCNLAGLGPPIILIISFPPALTGTLAAYLLGRFKLHHSIYFVPLTLSLFIAAGFPYIEKVEDAYLQTRTIPQVLKKIHAAEMAYSASRSDKGFACDGKQLPDIGKSDWGHVGGKTTNDLLIFRYYTVKLECRNNISPRSFRATAFSHSADYPDAPSFVIDPSGELRRLVETRHKDASRR